MRKSQRDRWSRAVPASDLLDTFICFSGKQQQASRGLSFVLSQDLCLSWPSFSSTSGAQRWPSFKRICKEKSNIEQFDTKFDPGKRCKQRWLCVLLLDVSSIFFRKISNITPFHLIRFSYFTANIVPHNI